MRTAQMSLLCLTCLVLSLATTGEAIAGKEAFAKGPLIKDFGQHAEVKGAAELPANQTFNVAFDVADGSDGDAENRKINSLARFINMHVAAGVTPKNIKLALVVHGKATFDVTNMANTANQNLLKTLMANGVSVYVCGQSAAYYDVTSEDLLPGVNMTLSAMTAHALLQQQGFTLNPF